MIWAHGDEITGILRQGYNPIWVDCTNNEVGL
jgi:hypothetical protein